MAFWYRVSAGTGGRLLVAAPGPGTIPVAPDGGGAAGGWMGRGALAFSPFCCCSLPIWLEMSATASRMALTSVVIWSILAPTPTTGSTTLFRSEERRVGEEWRS